LYSFVHAKESIKGQRHEIFGTKEWTDVTSQNFIKILSLETIPLKSNNSIYKITTPSYGVKEEICRRMPRNFFSPTPIPAKAKMLGLLSIYKFSLLQSLGKVYCRAVNI
jgi:hypothetical protein